MKKKLIILFILCTSYMLNAQNISYKVLDSDIETHAGFIGLGGSMFLGGATILGISIDARAQYDLDLLPLTLWFQGHRELVGVAHIDRTGKSYMAKPMELNAGVMYPIISGRKKEGEVESYLITATHSRVDIPEAIKAPLKLKGK